jgi:hypothetical protein
MFRNSAGFFAANAHLDSGESSLRWLKSTRSLDTMHPSIWHAVDQVSMGRKTQLATALAIHDLVKRMPFACAPDYSALTASDVLQLERGDCFTKGMLFVALLRAANIPARMRFMSIPTHFLRGIIAVPEPFIMHAMAEVYLNEQWWATDTYVPDPELMNAALSKLKTEGKSMGYGIHRQGATHWDGCSHASAQCTSFDAKSAPMVDWGVSDDPETFYSDETHEKLRRNFVSRLKWHVAAPMVNAKVAALRDAHTQKNFKKFAADSC